MIFFSAFAWLWEIVLSHRSAVRTKRLNLQLWLGAHPGAVLPGSVFVAVLMWQLSNLPSLFSVSDFIQ